MINKSATSSRKLPAHIRRSLSGCLEMRLVCDSNLGFDYETIIKSDSIIYVLKDGNLHPAYGENHWVYVPEIRSFGLMPRAHLKSTGNRFPRYI